MSFRFTVSLFEADRDAGSPDAADITAILLADYLPKGVTIGANPKAKA